MDKILLGISASTHPDGVKKALFLKMISTASKPVSKDEVTTILQLSSHWVISEDQFLQDMGLQIFQAWAKYNPATYEDFFCHHFLISSFGESVSNPLMLIRFISDCLKTLQIKHETATKIIKTGVISLCRRFPDITIQGDICRLLLTNSDCIPESSFATTLCQTLITNTSILEIPTGDTELKTCMSAVGNIGHLLRAVWSTQPTTIIPSLQHVFGIISTFSAEESQNPSLALGALVQHIHMKVVEAVTKSAVADVTITDDRMTVALQRMIDWLSWPSVVNIDKWIITFLTNLALVNKFTILIKVTLLTVETMLSRLFFPIVRDCAFNVFSHMLLSFQHSPDAFHKILGQIPDLIKSLRTEDTPSSQSFITKLADLVYCLMYHHAGYPELYDPLLETLKDFPRPSETIMLDKLKQSAWTSKKGSGLGMELSSKFEPRSETGKTGLVNLGNTCYMNSVIQALFMSSKFCDDILSYPLFNRQSVMYNLQLCFAFLTHTQRAAYAPREFLRASRPPWFAPGSQQDCSEFLKYLLDRLDEEEKGWKKMMKNAAASISSSLSSPSSSSPSSPGPSTHEQDCSDGKEVKMETDAVGNPKEEFPSSSSSSSSGRLLGPVTLSASNMPVCQPTDETTAVPDTASCSSSTINNLERSSSLSKSWSSLKLKNGDSSLTSIVENYFGGKSATHIRCLNCGTVSSRKETFFDLPLAFPGTEGRDNLLGGHSDTPAEERQSEKSDYAAMELVQEGRSVVGASTLAAAAVGPDIHGGSRSNDSQSMAGSSSDTTASKTHLEDLLRHYFSPELLVKDNRYSCDKCQSLQDAEKTLEIVNAPEILIITLLRFSYDVKLQRRCKIMEDVRYPRVLHLNVNPLEGDCNVDGNHGGPCTKRTRQNSVGTAHCSTESDSDRTVQYVLSTVIVHSGMSSESGHYYCYACNDVDEIQRHLLLQKDQRTNGDGSGITMHDTRIEDHLPNKWFLFNDSRVTASKFESFGRVTQRFPRDTAYVLFYRKCHDEYGRGDSIDAVIQRTATSASSSSSTSCSSLSSKEKHLRKDLQDAIQKDNLHYIQERETEARQTALRKQRPASSAKPFYSRNFDDKNDPPGGCGIGGGGGGGGPNLSSNRLVF